VQIEEAFIICQGNKNFLIDVTFVNVELIEFVLLINKLLLEDNYSFQLSHSYDSLFRLNQYQIFRYLRKILHASKTIFMR
jgi:hypothetical protein